MPVLAAGVLALALFLFVSAASPQADTVSAYTATITPTAGVTAGDSQLYTLTITNDPSSTQPLGSADIMFPTGFYSVSAGAVTAPGPKTWNGDALGAVHLRAATAGDALDPGELVSMDVTAELRQAGANVWTTAAKESIDFTTGPFTLNGSDPTVTIDPGPLDHFAFDSIGSQAAGTPFVVTATAEDSFDNTVTSYPGGATLSGDLSNAPDTTPPSYGAFGTWTSGAATASVTAFAAETGVHVTATDGGATGDSNNFTVDPGPLDHFTIANIPTQTAGAPLSVDATAYDDWDNVKTDYAGGATVTGTVSSAPDTTPPSYGAFGTWTNGAATASVTAFAAETGVHVTVADGSASDDSNDFDVAPGPLDHFTFTAISTQTAGTAFNVTATAFDDWDNQKTDYSGGATLSGDLSNAPDTTPPSYGAFGTWTSGAATASVTAFAAETGVHVTATDGGATGDSNNFTVDPGPLDHFTIANIPTQTAGAPLSVDATAYDDWDNQKTNYGGGAALSGDLSNAPDSTTPIYGVFGTWTNGVASASATAFKAESNRHMTAIDGTKTGTSTPGFTVDPGPLDHFTIASVSTQTAGTAFNITATAFDDWDNQKTNYGGGATLSTDANPSVRGCGGGGLSPCSPVLGSFGAWTNGVASASVTLYKAETSRHVTATDSGKTGTSNAFTVTFNVPDKLTFVQQPTDTQPNLSITPAVQVLNEDHYGNPEVGVNVTMSLTPGTTNPGDVLSGTVTQPGSSAGISTFANLSINNLKSDRKLRASSGSIFQDSAFFNTANTVISCVGTCTATASDAFANITVKVTGSASFQLGAAAAAAASGKLSITLEPPKNICSQIISPVGDHITTNPDPSGTATSVEVSGTLLHRNNKGGVGNFVFCKDSGPGTPVHTVPSCNKQKTNLPCLVKVKGQGQGDVFFDMLLKKNPDGSWDPHIDGGGGR